MKTRDDRGQRVRVERGRRFPGLRIVDLEGSAPNDRPLYSIGARVSFSIGCLSGIVCLLALVAYLILTLSSGQGLAASIFAGTLVGVVSVIFLLGRAIARRHALGAAVREARAGARCVCGYELRGTGPEDDGCVVCPECAAAWRA